MLSRSRFLNKGTSCTNPIFFRISNLVSLFIKISIRQISHQYLVIRWTLHGKQSFTVQEQLNDENIGDLEIAVG